MYYGGDMTRYAVFQIRMREQWRKYHLQGCLAQDHSLVFAGIDHLCLNQIPAKAVPTKAGSGCYEYRERGSEPRICNCGNSLSDKSLVNLTFDGKGHPHG